MHEQWLIVTTTKMTDDPVKLLDLYGEEAVLSRVGKYNLVHLDTPSQEEVERRVRQFDPEELFEDDCPICQRMRAQIVDVIYTGRRR